MFLLTIFISLCSGIFLQKSGQIHVIKRFLLEEFPHYPKVAVYASRGLFYDIPKININIKHENYLKLSDMRTDALENLSGDASEFEYVNANVFFEKKLIPIEIRLKGDRHVHYNDEKKWSFRIKVKGEETLFRMKRFSIHKPRVRNYLYEWIFHTTLKDEGLCALRYEFLNVYVNGENLGLYALEEHFEKRLIENNNRKEGPILKFDENLIPTNPSSDPFFTIPITPFNRKKWSNTEYADLTQKGISLLESFRIGESNLNDTFDVDLLSKFYATIDLLKVHHASYWRSMRFYYNPITEKLEPIGYDGHYGSYDRSVNCLTAEFLTLKHDVSTFYINSKDWLSLIFNFKDENILFYKKYIKNLIRLSDPNYFKNFQKKHKHNISKYEDLIYSDFPSLKDHQINYGPELFIFKPHIIEQNCDYIRKRLFPKDSNEIIRSYLSHNDRKKIEISVVNIFSLPIVLKNIVTENGTEIVNFESNTILYPQINNKPVDYSKYTLSTDNTVTKTELTNLSLKFEILGVGNTLITKLLPWNHYNPKILGVLRENTINDISQFEFVDIDKHKKAIYFNKGDWELAKTIVIPKDYKCYIEQGFELDFLNGSSLISYSPIFASGDLFNPVVFRSSDSNGSGIFVLKTKNGSVFSHTHFLNLSNPNSNGWSLSGAVNFYEADVHLDNCIFKKNKSEDALNIIRSTFRIEHVLFENALFDALDSDFSKGNISHSQFNTCGNDAIDLSGSYINMESISIKGCKDKAISGGEKSLLIANDLEIKDSKIGIACKDQSTIRVFGLNIKNCRYDLTAYQKKSEFGPAELDIYNYNSEFTSHGVVIEKTSSLRIDGIYKKGNFSNLKKILY